MKNAQEIINYIHTIIYQTYKHRTIDDICTEEAIDISNTNLFLSINNMYQQQITHALLSNDDFLNITIKEIYHHSGTDIFALDLLEACTTADEELTKWIAILVTEEKAIVNYAVCYETEKVDSSIKGKKVRALVEELSWRFGQTY